MSFDRQNGQKISAMISVLNHNEWFEGELFFVTAAGHRLWSATEDYPQCSDTLSLNGSSISLVLEDKTHQQAGRVSLERRLCAKESAILTQGVSNLEDKVTHLKTKETNLKTQVTDLKTQVTELRTEVSELKVKLNKESKLSMNKQLRQEATQAADCRELSQIKIDLNKMILKNEKLTNSLAEAKGKLLDLKASLIYVDIQILLSLLLPLNESFKRLVLTITLQQSIQAHSNNVFSFAMTLAEIEENVRYVELQPIVDLLEEKFQLFLN